MKRDLNNIFAGASASRYNIFNRRNAISIDKNNNTIAATFAENQRRRRHSSLYSEYNLFDEMIKELDELILEMSKPDTDVIDQILDQRLRIQ
jgi:hypothetical protein